MPNQYPNDSTCELSTDVPIADYPLMEPLFELPKTSNQGGLI